MTQDKKIEKLRLQLEHSKEANKKLRDLAFRLFDAVERLRLQLEHSKEANKKLRDLAVRLFDAGGSAWHASDCRMTLPEFLGITDKEYEGLLLVKEDL